MWLSRGFAVCCALECASLTYAQPIAYPSPTGPLSISGTAGPITIPVPGIWQSNAPAFSGTASFSSDVIEFNFFGVVSLPPGGSANFSVYSSVCFELTEPRWVAAQRTGGGGTLGLIGPNPDLQLCSQSPSWWLNSFVDYLPAGYYYLLSLGVSVGVGTGTSPCPACQWGPIHYRVEVLPGPCVTPELRIRRSSPTTCLGATVRLNAEMDSAPQGTLRYQWWFGSPQGVLAGQTANSLEILDLDYANAGVFGCTVTNLCGIQGNASVLLEPCAADMTCDGMLAVSDVFAFLNAWFASDPRGDFNRFNGTTVADIFDFLTAWFRGCS